MENNRTGLTSREVELVQQFAKAKLESEGGMPYEDLDDSFELPHPAQFSMRKKPTLSIKYGSITFNMAAIRLFEGIIHVLPFVSGKLKKVAVAMRKNEGAATVEWAREKDGRFVNKPITSVEFSETIYNMMGWEKSKSFKVIGNVSDSKEGLILVFELKEAVMYSEQAEEYFDRRTGQMKKRKFAYYPEMYAGHIGKTYSDYIASEQILGFEDLSSYSAQGSGAPPNDAPPDNAPPGEEPPVTEPQAYSPTIE